MKIGTAVKPVLFTALGVMLAGYVMYAARDITFVNDARRGFDV